VQILPFANTIPRGPEGLPFSAVPGRLTQLLNSMTYAAAPAMRFPLAMPFSQNNALIINRFHISGGLDNR
jgi:hypothetical protein